MQQCKSEASTKSTIANVSGLFRYIVDFPPDGGVALTGDSSIVLIRDCLEHAATRGRTAPAATMHSLGFWASAIQLDWPLDHALACAASAVESDVTPKQAPAMSIVTAKLLECIAANTEDSPLELQFAACIPPMSYDSFRFSGAQRPKSLDVNRDSIHGALLTGKNKKPHVPDWPRARPHMGMARAAEWIHPILDYRNARDKTNGTPPAFTFPRIRREWELGSTESANYSTTRRKLALLCSPRRPRLGVARATTPKKFRPPPPPP